MTYAPVGDSLSINLGPISADNVAVAREPLPLDSYQPTAAHAPADWTDTSSRPLCEVAGRLERIEHPWFAITRGGVRCPDCLEWMHA